VAKSDPDRQYKIMKPFQLYDELTGKNHCLQILAAPEEIEDLFDYRVLGTDEMNFLETTYGVHDVSYDDNSIFGFTSYEWQPGKLDDLKTYWSNWLTRLGFKVGKWS